MIRYIWLSVLIGLTQSSPTVTPQSAMDQLLETDRSFSSAAAGKTPLDAISAMFAADVSVPVGADFVQGRDKVMEAMKSNPDYRAGSVKWTPIGGGISADGTQGFTFGYMDATRANGSTAAFKYLAYWVKASDGWRVGVYRRRPRPEGSVSTAPMAPALPARMVTPSTDAARMKNDGDSLAAAEKAFSDLAQTAGLGDAFAKNGRADAVNMGGPKDASFVVGAEAIARSVSEGAPKDRSELEWSADRVLVASSGDLGVTIGRIRLHKPQPGQPGVFPFFTVWRRDDPSKPWRYIAE